MEAGHARVAQTFIKQPIKPRSSVLTSYSATTCRHLSTAAPTETAGWFSDGPALPDDLHGGNRYAMAGSPMLPAAVGAVTPC